MRLGVFVQTPGHHVAGWRHPDAVSGGPNLELMKHIAATAERGKFDMFFLGDGFATGYGEHPSTNANFDPISLLSALAMGTSRLGLAATAGGLPELIVVGSFPGRPAFRGLGELTNPVIDAS